MIYEFFRGALASEKRPKPASHVILESARDRPLTMAQAIEQGVDLKAVGVWINEQLVQELARNESEKQKASERFEAYQTAAGKKAAELQAAAKSAQQAKAAADEKAARFESIAKDMASRADRLEEERKRLVDQLTEALKREAAPINGA